jgi:hypothetical protein
MLAETGEPVIRAGGVALPTAANFGARLTAEKRVDEVTASARPLTMARCVLKLLTSLQLAPLSRLLEYVALPSPVSQRYTLPARALVAGATSSAQPSNRNVANFRMSAVSCLHTVITSA